MKRYWKLFKEISRLTHAGALKWCEVDSHAYAGLVANPGRTIRQYETPFSYRGRPATLVCVERRIYLDEDYLFPFEDVTGELLIVENGLLVEKIAEPLVPWYWLKGLAGAIANARKRVIIPQQA